MKYRVITTEMWSGHYIVEANDEEEAIQAVRLTEPSEAVHLEYNETIKDRDSMYVLKLPDWEKGDKVADVVEKWS